MIVDEMVGSRMEVGRRLRISNAERACLGPDSQGRAFFVGKRNLSNDGPYTDIREPTGGDAPRSTLHATASASSSLKLLPERRFIAYHTTKAVCAPLPRLDDSSGTRVLTQYQISDCWSLKLLSWRNTEVSPQWLGGLGETLLSWIHFTPDADKARTGAVTHDFCSWLIGG